VAFNSGDSFELVFQVRNDLTQFRKHLGISIPVAAAVSFKETIDSEWPSEDSKSAAVRASPRQAGTSLRLLRKPNHRQHRRSHSSESIRKVVLDFSHASMAVLQHSFVPLWIQGLRARLEPDRFFQRAYLRVTR